MPIDNIPQLIKTARNGRSQTEFARELGIRQPTLSRYEKGETNPKAHIIEKCMHLVHWEDKKPAPTVDELAQKIKVLMKGDEHAQLRITLSYLIDGLTAEKVQKLTNSKLSCQSKRGGRHDDTITN